MPRHHAPPRRRLRRGPDQTAVPKETGIIARGEGRAQLPRQKARQHALRMAEETRILHIVLPHGGRRENPRGAEVQAGGDALAPPQRRVRLRHHRTAQERGMKAEWEANEDAARRREPTVGQEAVSPRSRMRRLVRSQWLTQRHGRLNTACCLSVEGVATTKQRLDRAVGPAAAPCAQIPPRPQRFFNELKSHPADRSGGGESDGSAVLL